MGIGTKLLTLLGSPAGFTLPYSVDFSALPNGALPAKFVGASWSIASGKAINTPTEGNELVSNGNMETGDPVTSWSSLNSSTIASVADERTGGAGSKSGEVTAGAAFGTVRQQITLAKNAHGVYRLWYKKGTSNGFVSVPSFAGPTPSDAAWASYEMRGQNAAANPYVSIGCATNAGTSRYDDVSAKELTGIFSGFLAPSTLVTVKGATTLTTLYTPIGFFMCGNSETPTSGVFATIHIYSAGFVNVKLWKLVNGTYTEVKTTNVGYVAGALLEIRRTASTTFQIWYNGTQRGTDGTISDAEIVSNQYVGLYSDGGSGNSIGSFFLL